MQASSESHLFFILVVKEVRVLEELGRRLNKISGSLTSNLPGKTAVRHPFVLCVVIADYCLVTPNASDCPAGVWLFVPTFGRGDRRD